MLGGGAGAGPVLSPFLPARLEDSSARGPARALDQRPELHGPQPGPRDQEERMTPSPEFHRAPQPRTREDLAAALREGAQRNWLML